MNNIVYLATLPNGKIYIGRTSRSLNRRILDHIDESNRNRGHGCPAFHSALIKYGYQHVFWAILHSNLSFVDSIRTELEEIKKHNSNDPSVGYNLMSGSNSVGVASHSESTKKKISLSVKNSSKEAWNSDKRRQKASANMMEQWIQDDLRNKRSLAIRQVRSSDEQRSLSSKDSSKRYNNINKRKEMAIACGAKQFNVFKGEVFIGTWVNAAQCAKDLNLNTKTHISNCLYGRRNTYKGYRFIKSETTKASNQSKEK